jgi:hypothetical protein
MLIQMLASLVDLSSSYNSSSRVFGQEVPSFFRIIIGT